MHINVIFDQILSLCKFSQVFFPPVFLCGTLVPHVLAPFIQAFIQARFSKQGDKSLRKLQLIHVKVMLSPNCIVYDMISLCCLYLCNVNPVSMPELGQSQADAVVFHGRAGFGPVLALSRPGYDQFMTGPSSGRCRPGPGRIMKVRACLQGNSIFIYFGNLF